MQDVEVRDIQRLQRHGRVTRVMGDFCIVDRDIYCPRSSFADGLVPRNGQAVKVDAIRHQQGQNKWRAVLLTVAASQTGGEGGGGGGGGYGGGGPGGAIQPHVQPRVRTIIGRSRGSGPFVVGRGAVTGH